MLKSELIAALQAIEGDPHVFIVIDNRWSSRHWSPEVHTIEETELVGYDIHEPPAIGETVILL